MKRVVELYGRLREAGLGGAVEIEAREGASAADVLAAVRQAFGARAALLEGAVLATESAVLAAGDVVPDATLAVLPPVCGG